eukprot:TRINITY_DN69926_c0_g1_i1.p3 TRINITY_DN69926_c0_g1~~TRINITY_DN69926_c0_g1_i1.p3  ORF type:complete len:131 (-),score=5.29 TRINITY_DN69926_c0_g1_i1:705-1097(-)
MLKAAWFGLLLWFSLQVTGFCIILAAQRYGSDRAESELHEVLLLTTSYLSVRSFWSTSRTLTAMERDAPDKYPALLQLFTVLLSDFYKLYLDPAGDEVAGNSTSNLVLADLVGVVVVYVIYVVTLSLVSW